MPAPSAVLLTPLAGLPRRTSVADETASIRNSLQPQQAAHALPFSLPVGNDYGKNPTVLCAVAGERDVAALADAALKRRRGSHIVASARNSVDAEPVDPVEFCRRSVHAVQQAMLDALWIDEVEKGHEPESGNTRGVVRGETSVSAATGNGNRRSHRHSSRNTFGGWGDDRATAGVQLPPQLVSKSLTSSRALRGSTQQGNGRSTSLEEDAVLVKQSRAGSMHFPFASHLMSAGESRASVVGATGATERSGGGGLCNAEVETEAGLYGWWQPFNPTPPSRALRASRSGKEADDQGVVAAGVVAAAPLAAGAHGCICAGIGSTASVRANGGASAIGKGNVSASGNAVPTGEFYPMVAVATAPVAAMRARQLAGTGGDGGTSASVLVSLTRRRGGAGERQAQEVGRVRAIGARSSGEGETEGESQESEVGGDGHIDRTSSNVRGADGEASANLAAVEGSSATQSNEIENPGGRGGQVSDSGSRVATPWWGQEGQGDEEGEERVAVVRSASAQDGQSTAGVKGSGEGGRSYDIEQDLGEAVKAEEEEEEEEEEEVPGEGGGEPASVVDDPWDVVSRFWHHPAVVKIRMSITMTNLTMALPTFLANVLPIIRSVGTGRCFKLGELDGSAFGVFGSMFCVNRTSLYHSLCTTIHPGIVRTIRVEECRAATLPHCLVCALNASSHASPRHPPPSFSSIQIRLPLIPVLLHEVSLPLLAPVLFGGGIVFKATLNNLGVVLPRVG